MKAPGTAAIPRRGVLGLLALGTVAAAARSAYPVARARPDPDGPRLRITNGAAPVRTEALPALWLALASTPPERRAAFLDDLEAAFVSAAARANPLLVDVLDLDPEAVLDEARPWLLPLCTAASSLLAPTHVSADGFAVEVLSPSTTPSPDDVPAWSADDAGPARRARFLAWPVARALVVRGPANGLLGSLDDALGRSSLDPGGSVALVLSAPALRGNGDPRIATVLRRLSDGASRMHATGDVLRAASIPERGGDLVPWIALAENERLVVPKLGAIAPRARFPDEVRRIASAHGAAIVGGAG
ncbi:MAG TPA: hypothetical protein VHE30_22235 [Polyangiaceae bacterium]|nr:hypothetical protein [Polyangiaceae bacterium]